MSETYIYFKPVELKQYLILSDKSKNIKINDEILIALTARKIFEPILSQKGELLFGFPIKANKINLDKKNKIPIKDIGNFLSKYGEIDTLTDIIISYRNFKGISSNQIKLQIKHFGYGKTKNGGTEAIIKLFEKCYFDAASDEKLIIFLEEERGYIDFQEIRKKVNFERISYPQIITMHYTKLDMLMHYVCLKPELNGNFLYNSFSREEVITI